MALLVLKVLVVTLLAQSHLWNQLVLDLQSGQRVQWVQWVLRVRLDPCFQMALMDPWDLLLLLLRYRHDLLYLL